MNIRLNGRGALARTAAVSVTALAVLGLWAPAAQAATATTVPLDPSSYWLQVYPTYGDPAPADSQPGVSLPTAFAMVSYGGTLTFGLPAPVEAGPLFRVDIELAPSDTAVATRTYSSTSSVPADVLVVNDLGGQRYEVELPADDGVNGDIGLLTIHGLVPAAGVSGASIEGANSATNGGHEGDVFSKLAFTTAPAAVEMPLGLVAYDLACYPSDIKDCGVTSVAAGSTINLTLPVSSRLNPLGVTDLRRSAVTLRQVVSNGAVEYADYAHIELSGPISADGRGVAIALPSGLSGRKYLLSTEAVGPTGSVLALAPVVLDVTRYNFRLRSNTGWGEHDGTTSSGTSPLVPIGATMILAAGLGTAVVLRRRTALQD
jgi:hypothetical protein